MPYDGSGNFNRTFPPGGWQGDAAGAIKIRADRHDQHDADLAAGLSNAICRDGQSQVTANIPFNTKKITNLGTPTAPTDAATKAYVDTAAAAAVYTPPVGAGMEFWGAVAPPKWVLAHGQVLSRATYSALFAILGTTYGVGDGSSTFAMPDVRGRTVAGKDNMGGASADRLTALTGGVNGDVLGAVGGAESHVLTEAQMPSHTHIFTGTAATVATGGQSQNHTHTVPGNVPSGTNSVNTAGYNTAGYGPMSNNEDTGAASVDHTHNVTITPAGTNAAKGSGTAHNNVQPTIVANYIIYAGV